LTQQKGQLQLARQAGEQKLRITSAPLEEGAVEVTPEMIAVGALILREYAELGSYTAKHLAEDIYRAMVAAQPHTKDC
jgi:hypothetical protein